MTLSAIDKLGEKLGGLAAEQNVIKDNINPADPLPQLQLVSFEKVVVGGSIKVYQPAPDDDSFVIDHPVLGEIDSAVLKIDGGYKTLTVTIPVTMPILLGLDQDLIFTANF